MAVDLYGDTYIDNWDYARKIVTKGMNLPFYKVHSHITSRGGCSMSLTSEHFPFLPPDSKTISTGGLYAIYEGNWNNMSCLYVGASLFSMKQRVFRFMKELHGVSRHDEDHPAARKARRDGINPNTIFVKFFPIQLFPSNVNMRVYDVLNLDETCAILLKSRYNKKRKY